MKEASSERPRPGSPARIRGGEVALLFFVLGAGVALGLVLRQVLLPGSPAAPSANRPAVVQADPRTLVTQPEDLPRQYVIQGDPEAADPGATHPRQRYSVTISRSDVAGYAAQAAVNLYASEDEARAALRTLLGLGQFGSELPLHETLGDEGHLYAARAGDRPLVVGSVIWRDRNLVAYVFVYSPYPDQVPPDAVERLARANAYDDTMGVALPIERRVKGGP